MHIQELLEKVQLYAPDIEKDALLSAFEFAQEAHTGQKLKNGEPYIQHLLATAAILADLKVDQLTLVAALLHDILQRTSITAEALEEKFGAQIRTIAEEVVHLSKIRYRPQMSESQAELLQKIAISMTHDLRSMLIKLASRLHSLSVMQEVQPEARTRVAAETMYVYAPLADLMGIWRLRWQLEDISFQYLLPQEFEKIQAQFLGFRKVREEYVERITSSIQRAVGKAGIACKVEGRFKHFYSTYCKMKSKHKEFDEIYDLFALRVLVEDPADCYRVLGVIHNLFPPIPGRVKDYIATPKPNGYQTLHTTVWGIHNTPVEVQIRTQQMHAVAQYGVAAHWYYKQADRFPFRHADWIAGIFHWRRRWQYQEGNLPVSLKLKVLQDRIFVFTPKGDVIELPLQATAIDLAYRINSSLGHRCQGAIVNNQETSLQTPLRTGDTVYIIAGEEEHPQSDWLSWVKTPLALKAIKRWFQDNEEDPIVRRGRLMLQKHLLRVTAKPLGSFAKKLLQQFPTCTTVEALYRQVASGTIAPHTVLQTLLPEKEILFSPLDYRSWPAPSQRTITLAVRTRLDNHILRRLLKIFSDLDLSVERVVKRFETSINRKKICITFTANCTEQLFQVCSRMEQIPAVESIAKS